MIVSLFKNCALLQQFHTSISSFNRDMFYKIFCQKSHHVNGFVSSMPNGYNIGEPNPLLLNSRM